MPINGGNLIKEQATGTGTGNITLAGAEQSFFSFSSQISTTTKVFYGIVDGINREVGVGTFTPPATLTRDVVEQSNNGGAKISLSGTGLVVYFGIPYDHIVHTDENFNIANPSPFRATTFINTRTLMIGEEGLDTDETVLIKGLNTVGDFKGGLFYFDAGDATAEDPLGYDTFRNVNSPAIGLHKRVRSDLQSPFFYDRFDFAPRVNAAPDVRIYQADRETNPDDYFNITTAAGKLVINARLNQTGEESFIELESLGTEADKIIFNKPVVMTPFTGTEANLANNSLYVSDDKLKRKAASGLIKTIAEFSGNPVDSYATLTDLLAVTVNDPNGDPWAHGDVIEYRGILAEGDIDAPRRVTWDKDTASDDDLGVNRHRPANITAGNPGRFVEPFPVRGIKFADSDPTPSLKDGEVFIVADTPPAAYTGFDDLREGKTIRLNPGAADAVFTHAVGVLELPQQKDFTLKTRANGGQSVFVYKENGVIYLESGGGGSNTAILASGVGDDVADDRTAMFDDNAAAVADGLPLQFVRGRTYRINSNITFTSETRFNGAILKPNTGATITFDVEPVFSESEHVFDLSLGGNVAFTDASKRLSPANFGADKTTATDSITQVNQCITVAGANNLSTIIAHRYRCDTAVQITTDKQHVIFEGPGAIVRTTKNFAFGTDYDSLYGIHVSGCRDVVIEGACIELDDGTGAIEVMPTDEQTVYTFNHNSGDGLFIYVGATDFKTAPPSSGSVPWLAPGGSTVTLNTSDTGKLPQIISQTVPSANAATNIFTRTSHDMFTGDKIAFFAGGGSLPAGVTEGQIYYVQRLSADTYKVFPTPEDLWHGTNEVDVTSAGSNFEARYGETVVICKEVLDSSSNYSNTHTALAFQNADNCVATDIHVRGLWYGGIHFRTGCNHCKVNTAHVQGVINRAYYAYQDARECSFDDITCDGRDILDSAVSVLAYGCVAGTGSTRNAHGNRFSGVNISHTRTIAFSIIDDRYATLVENVSIFFGGDRGFYIQAASGAPQQCALTNFSVIMPTPRRGYGLYLRGIKDYKISNGSIWGGNIPIRMEDGGGETNQRVNISNVSVLYGEIDGIYCIGGDSCIFSDINIDNTFSGGFHLDGGGARHKFSNITIERTESGNAIRTDTISHIQGSNITVDSTGNTSVNCWYCDDVTKSLFTNVTVLGGSYGVRVYDDAGVTDLEQVWNGVYAEGANNYGFRIFTGEHVAGNGYLSATVAGFLDSVGANTNFNAYAA